jgi:hypothetical protein
LASKAVSQEGAYTEALSFGTAEKYHGDDSEASSRTPARVGAPVHVELAPVNVALAPVHVELASVHVAAVAPVLGFMNSVSCPS